jgi:hypothetical protein
MDRNIFYAEDFKSTVQCKFEGFNFPVPVGYHRVLEVLYRDYMKFPPTEQRGIWHDNVIFDADIPYSKYLKENK